jgi:hypothetical protein
VSDIPKPPRSLVDVQLANRDAELVLAKLELQDRDDTIQAHEITIQAHVATIRGLENERDDRQAKLDLVPGQIDLAVLAAVTRGRVGRWKAYTVILLCLAVAQPLWALVHAIAVDSATTWVGRVLAGVSLEHGSDLLLTAAGLAIAGYELWRHFSERSEAPVQRAEPAPEPLARRAPCDLPHGDGQDNAAISPTLH